MTMTIILQFCVCQEITRFLSLHVRSQHKHRCNCQSFCLAAQANSAWPSVRGKRNEYWR